MSEQRSERREWVKKLRDEMDGPRAGTCPVCSTNVESLVEGHRREVERLRGALMLIAGQENTRFHTDEGMSISLDADEKMRQIAREVLR